MPHPTHFKPVPDPDPALLAQVRGRYEAGELSYAGVARLLGMSASTIASRIANNWFWRVPPKLASARALRARRLEAIEQRARDRRREQGEDVPLTPADLSPHQLHRRLMVQVARLMRAMEANIAPDGLPIDPERHARLLSVVMKQQAEIARVKADQEATVLRIQQEQENANRLSIAQTKKEAALMEADALVIAAEGQRKAAAMQGSQYGEHPSLLQIRLAEIQAAVMAKASISIMVAPDQVSHAMGAFANMGQFLQMAGGSSAPAPAGSVSGAKIAMSSSSSSSK